MFSSHITPPVAIRIPEMYIKREGTKKERRITGSGALKHCVLLFRNDDFQYGAEIVSGTLHLVNPCWQVPAYIHLLVKCTFIDLHHPAVYRLTQAVHDIYSVHTRLDITKLQVDITVRRYRVGVCPDVGFTCKGL